MRTEKLIYEIREARDCFYNVAGRLQDAANALEAAYPQVLQERNEDTEKE